MYPAVLIISQWILGVENFVFGPPRNQHETDFNLNPSIEIRRQIKGPPRHTATSDSCVICKHVVFYHMLVEHTGCKSHEKSTAAFKRRPSCANGRVQIDRARAGWRAALGIEAGTGRSCAAASLRRSLGATRPGSQ